MKKLLVALVLGVSLLAVPGGVRHANAASLNGAGGFCSGVYNATYNSYGSAAYNNSPTVYTGYYYCYVYF